MTTVPVSPSPTQGLQVLDPSGTWVPMGTIDPASHVMAGAGGPGVVYATQPNIGMQASTPGNVFDNGPLVDTFNTVSNASSSTTIFPGSLNGQSATYYFSNTLHWISHGVLTCQGADYYSAPVLAFAPGRDGVSFDNGYVSPKGGAGEGTLDGCRIISLGWGSGGSSDGANFITQTVMPGYGPIPGTTWEVGDGIIATSTGSGYLHPHYPNVTTLKHGAYVAAVDTSNTDTGYGLRLTLGAGYKSDYDNDNTLYSFKYATNATSAWIVGATTISVADCSVFGYNYEVHDTQYSPAKMVGKVNDCTGTTLTLRSGALVGALGTTDRLNRNVGAALIRLPVELAYNTTTQGPTNITATAAWNAGDTTISVPSGACNGIITGDMINAASGAPITYGALVLDYTANPANPWLLGSVKSCSGTTMTFNAGIPNASTGAGDALTSVSRMMMISGGDGTRLNESDYIWSDAFELGNMVTPENWGSPANGGTETVVIHGARDYAQDNSNGWPASGRWAGLDPRVKPCPLATPYPYGCIVGQATHAAGSGHSWKLPAGFHKRATSDSRNISPRGFFIGYEDVGNGAQGAAGRDWGNYIVDNMIGRVNGGDDIAPNNEYAGMYGGNTIFDIASMETVSGTSWGTNTNSAEGGSAIQSIMNCSGHSFIGTYSSDFTWWVPSQRSACMAGDGAFSVPPMPGYTTILNGGAGTAPYPNGDAGVQFLPMGGGTLGQVFMSQGGVSGGGVWQVSNYNMGVANVSVTSPANQSIISGMPSESWVFPGLGVRDLTTPTAIPDGTYVSRIVSASAILLDHNLAQPVPANDQLQFYTPASSGGACTTIKPAFTEGWGMIFDLLCNNQGVGVSYNGVEGMWGLGYGQGNIYVGFPFGTYRGLSAGLVLPGGFLLGGAVTGSDIYQRRINYDYQGPVNYHTSNLKAVHGFTYGVNQKLILSACDYPLTQGNTGMLDTSLSGNPVIGFTAGCSSTPVLVLVANSTQTSVANMDVLTIGGVTVNAGDFFSTSNNAFPIADCTGVTNGATVKDTSISGSPTVGAVSSCASQNVLALTVPVQANSAGQTDSLLATANPPGNIIFNVSPVNTVGMVEKYVSTPDTETLPFPFGQISGDTSGISWPTGVPASIDDLPTCDATHRVGMSAVIKNGVANPARLQVVSADKSAGGSATRRVFCDGTAWLYD